MDQRPFKTRRIERDLREEPVGKNVSIYETYHKLALDNALDLGKLVAIKEKFSEAEYNNLVDIIVERRRL